VSEADDKRARAQGYKPVVKNGTIYYCRSEPLVGSHFEQKVCRTSVEITAQGDQARKDMLDRNIQPMHSGN
jgi:hypothetical protein